MGNIDNGDWEVKLVPDTPEDEDDFDWEDTVEIDDLDWDDDDDMDWEDDDLEDIDWSDEDIASDYFDWSEDKDTSSKSSLLAELGVDTLEFDIKVKVKVR